MTYSTTLLIVGISTLVPCSLVLASEEVLSSNTSIVSVQRSLDPFAEPQWLQDVPVQSKVAKYRKRRFLSFPSGSTLKVTLLFGMPVTGLGTSSTLGIEHAITFNLPTTSTSFVFGRTDDTHQRIDIYRKVEEVLGGFGFDGHACTLRSICEIAEMPFDHGIVGEVINLLFSVVVGPSSLHSSPTYDEYSTAEYYGRHHGSCASLYPRCHASVTELMSNFI